MPIRKSFGECFGKGSRAPPHAWQPRTSPSGPDIWALVGLSSGRRSGVAGARAYQLVFDLLLQRVCDPAGGAADREQGEGAAWFEAQRAAQRYQREIDVRL